VQFVSFSVNDTHSTFGVLTDSRTTATPTSRHASNFGKCSCKCESSLTQLRELPYLLLHSGFYSCKPVWLKWILNCMWLENNERKSGSDDNFHFWKMCLPAKAMLVVHKKLDLRFLRIL